MPPHLLHTEVVSPAPAPVIADAASHDLPSIFTIADRRVMPYNGVMRMIGSREDFKRYPDAVVQRFITRSTQAPIE